MSKISTELLQGGFYGQLRLTKNLEYGQPKHCKTRIFLKSYMFQFDFIYNHLSINDTNLWTLLNIFLAKEYKFT